MMREVSPIQYSNEQVQAWMKEGGREWMFMPRVENGTLPPHIVRLTNGRYEYLNIDTERGVIMWDSSMQGGMAQKWDPVRGSYATRCW
jgi:hypothetical protein